MPAETVFHKYEVRLYLPAAITCTCWPRHCRSDRHPPAARPPRSPARATRRALVRRATVPVKSFIRKCYQDRKRTKSVLRRMYNEVHALYHKSTSEPTHSYGNFRARAIRNEDGHVL